jgi:hypothetical protein
VFMSGAASRDSSHTRLTDGPGITDPDSYKSVVDLASDLRFSVRRFLPGNRLGDWQCGGQGFESPQLHPKEPQVSGLVESYRLGR